MSRGDRKLPPSGCERKGAYITAVIVWLLMGAIVNVAVAWGLALCLDPLAPARNTPQGSWQQSIDHREGTWSVWSNRRIGSLWILSSPRYRTGFEGTASGPPPDTLIPAWAASSLTPTATVAYNDPSLGRLYRTAHATGWPTLSMAGMYRGDQTDEPIARSALVIGVAPWSVGPPVSGQITVPRAVLLRPLWPGFAINTLFYAGLVWLLFAVPRALRRRRRVKQGLCPKCAYPVGASDFCTECGAAVNRRSVISKSTAG